MCIRYCGPVDTPGERRIGCAIPFADRSAILRALTDGEATVIVAVPRFYQALTTAVEACLRRMGRLAWSLFRGALALSIKLRRRFGVRIGPRLFAALHRRFAAGSHWSGWTGVMFRNRLMRLVSRATRACRSSMDGGFDKPGVRRGCP